MAVKIRWILIFVFALLIALLLAFVYYRTVIAPGGASLLEMFHALNLGWGLVFAG